MPGPPEAAGLCGHCQGPSLPSQESQAEGESELKKIFHFILNKKTEQTELLEILKTTSSLRQNFTEISVRSVGTEPGPSPPEGRLPGTGGGAGWGGLCSGSAGARPTARAPLCAPHAPPGVVVVVEVPQAQPLHLQPGLQHSGGDVGGGQHCPEHAEPWGVRGWGAQGPRGCGRSRS